MRASVPHASLCPLQAFPNDSIVVDHAALVAGTLAPLRGPLYGTALLAFDPRDALALIYALRGDTERPELEAANLSLFVEAAGALLGSLVQGLTTGLPEPGELAEPRLVEDALSGILIATHAPPDTAVISVEVALELPARAPERASEGASDAETATQPRTLTGAAYLLVEPKALAGAMATLAAAPPAATRTS